MQRAHTGIDGQFKRHSLDSPESIRPRSLVLAAVAALAGAWWSVGTLNSLTRKLTDRSAYLVEPCALSMPVCPAAGTPAARPQAPLTNSCREALCKVFIVSRCVLDCVIGTVPRMLPHALAPCFLMTSSESQVRCGTPPVSDWVSPWLFQGCPQCAENSSACCFVIMWMGFMPATPHSPSRRAGLLRCKVLVWTVRVTEVSNHQKPS